MTFEEFKKLAANPPKREEDTIFELIQYDVKPLPERRRNHYPKFDVWESRIGYAKNLEAAETLIKNAIEAALKCNTEIYCFHIKEFPIGKVISDGLGVSCRLYDGNGNFLDRTYCSDLDRDFNTEYGRFRGRIAETQRFKTGDIVEVLDGDHVRLAIAMASVISPEWCWEHRESIKTVGGRESTEEEVDRFYIWDSSDDQITVIDGPDFASHEHVSPLFIMPLRYSLSKKLRERYEKYYQSVTKRE